MVNGYLYYLQNLRNLVNGTQHFQGWGRKRTGRFAQWCQKRFGGDVTLLEDGFIRSIGLGVEGALAFSMVEDDVGIYYDATMPSKLENLLNHYDFSADAALMVQAREAMALIGEHHISKYNHAPDVAPKLFETGQRRVLVVAQTAGDASLKYGLAEQFTTGAMIEAAISENPGAQVYVKIHPDVLNGTKASDIDRSMLRDRCHIIDADVNPISLLKHFEIVYTKTSQMGFEALLLGKRCVCFGMPFYAGWGVTEDRLHCERRQAHRSVEEIFAAAYILYSRYWNPYTLQSSNLLDTIRTIQRFRELERPAKVEAFFFGFSRWKHPLVEPFFKEFRRSQMHFVNPLFGGDPLVHALNKGLDAQSRIYIWGRKAFEAVEAYAEEQGIPIYRVEDGFIRSVGLGSDLTQPYSQVVDGRGIYFDPMQPSDLEHLLEHEDFTEALERAAQVRKYLVENKLSKYNLYEEGALTLPKGRRIVVVPGQVEDDASIRFGATGMTNLELLKQTRQRCPDAYIIYKPHPDVLVGNRVGHVESTEALHYCDQIVTEVSLDSVLAHADEVHTMTSLVGFEALMRGIAVTTYGLPFYAGWGLTTDVRHCERRTRVLSLDELVAGVLLRYPRYIHPQTKRYCDAEVLLEALEQERLHYRHSRSYRLRRKIRNWVSRKVQLLLRTLWR